MVSEAMASSISSRSNSRRRFERRENDLAAFLYSKTHFIYDQYMESAIGAHRDFRKPRSGHNILEGKRMKNRTTVMAAAAVLAAAALATAADKAARKDIVDTAVSAGNFKTLVAAVQAAGLVDALKGPGPLTVFAPTDEAFAKLPPGTVEELLKPENKTRLQGILKYHVVAGNYKAAEVVKMHSAPTLQGEAVTIQAAGGGVTIDNAKVVKADILTSNGVIHVIDSVILPK
jgi:uncharacterized surface protein with fasciclin (FAS1) repeats